MSSLPARNPASLTSTCRPRAWSFRCRSVATRSRASAAASKGPLPSTSTPPGRPSPYARCEAGRAGERLHTCSVSSLHTGHVGQGAAYLKTGIRVGGDPKLQHLIDLAALLVGEAVQGLHST